MVRGDRGYTGTGLAGSRIAAVCGTGSCNAIPLEHGMVGAGFFGSFVWKEISSF